MPAGHDHPKDLAAWKAALPDPQLADVIAPKLIAEVERLQALLAATEGRVRELEWQLKPKLADGAALAGRR